MTSNTNTNPDTDDLAQTIFNKEIVRELLLQECQLTASDEVVDEIYNLCDGNPWNAAIMYDLLQLTKSGDTNLQVPINKSVD